MGYFIRSTGHVEPPSPGASIYSAEDAHQELGMCANPSCSRARGPRKGRPLRAARAAAWIRAPGSASSPEKWEARAGFPRAGRDQRLVVSSRRGHDAALATAPPLHLWWGADNRCIMSRTRATPRRSRGLTHFGLTFSTITLPSSPAFSTIWRMGSSSARFTICADLP